jgi:hypothetical protein
MVNPTLDLGLVPSWLSESGFKIRIIIIFIFMLIWVNNTNIIDKSVFLNTPNFKENYSKAVCVNLFW